MSPFVGRAEPLARLRAAPSGLVLVTGEAGIGKTALLSHFATEAGALFWGTAWDDDRAPAWWPWTQALRGLLECRPELLADADPRLAAIVPDLIGAPATADPADTGRVLVFDAVARLLHRAGPAVVVLDDLQWADPSTVELLHYLARQRGPARLRLVGAYRPGEASPPVAAALADLAGLAEPIALTGLTAGAVAELITTLAGDEAATAWASLVHRRSGGHPFLARELCHLLAAGGAADEVPAAAREAVRRRLHRLPEGCRALLDVAAVAGPVLYPDVLAEVTGASPEQVADRAAEAVTAGILAGDGSFAHDLYRETIYAGLTANRRLDLHARVGQALQHRHDRGGRIFPAELARHFTAAGATGPAVSWAHAAADADTARYAFAEAAGHLARVRAAAADTGRRLSAADLVGLLTREAELRSRAGATDDARELLETAWQQAAATGAAGATRAAPAGAPGSGGDPELLGLVALGLDRLGARFAMPRTDLIAVLETARAALDGRGTPAEAQVTAALARQLQHSVPADRPRAAPYAERAVAIARGLDDPATLASCLLAQHDVLWTPGTGAQRAAIAAEIAAAARLAGDPERAAQALLLTANAHLENGSAAFRAAFTEFAYVTERLRQPRHDYVLRTRQAALALLDGDLAAAERLSDEAAGLGEAAGDSDTGNVRMSQRLELVRARGEPDELRRTAAEAVRWWVGAPAHAHAVAAGFLARAGDLDAARREVDTVLALDDWRADRSYLWSVFAGELAAAAIALGDRALCTLLLADLRPLAGTCTVNGALVCFMGAHAHRVGLLEAALGDTAAAAASLRQARDIHRRLGARLWERESERALAALVPPGPELRWVGDLWQLNYRGHTDYLRDAKGLRDLATLLARPGTDVPAVDLAGGAPADRIAPDPVLDRAALRAYRNRLAELDAELAGSDLGRRERAAAEREQLLTGLRRATRPGGAARELGGSAAERARKAVSARIRDAIRRIGTAQPELGRHLDRAVRTGHLCRYEPD
ncbi:ATP-binding protein [Paractinoplanes rishiriensis]|uniref:Orc1-like AAA ATPase domain-containing protein n=1 Tax=Paractinoplanes rishiriensis TaxID=1050105 RepID=A0A919JY04_9ACTN|nr:AAA family ATPase [Actinoplanes rishiriensis]GIE95597.1 hypothetical protein Ari01nite_30620 [Actinoplanes rishiriensis]